MFGLAEGNGCSEPQISPKLKAETDIKIKTCFHNAPPQMLQKLSVNIIKVIYIGLMRDVFTQYLKTSRRMAANWKREELGKMMSRTPTQFGHLRLCSTWKIIIVMTASCDSTGGKANGGTLTCEMYLQLCIHFEAEVTITSNNKPWCFWWCFCVSLLFQNKIHIPG